MTIPANLTLPAVVGNHLVLGSILTALPGRWSNPDAVTVPIDGTYGLIFDEEFNGTTLDLTKWNPSWFGATSTTVSGPIQSTEEAAYDPAQISVGNGFLALTTIAKQVAVGGLSYSFRTGHIDTNPSASVASPGFATNPTTGNPVYLEARVFIPSDGAATPNVVNWPSALITFGQNWPVTGEIDVAEGLNMGTPPPPAGMTANYHSSAGGQQSGPLSSNYTGWHVFAALWTTTTVTYYYDGVQVKQYTTGIASAPNYLMLQNAMGQTTAGGIDQVGAALLAEYVHVYLKGGTPISSQTNYGGAGATFTGGYTYQWYRGSAPVTGATNPTYVTSRADEGAAISVSVAAVNGSGSSLAALSASTLPIVGISLMSQACL